MACAGRGLKLGCLRRAPLGEGGDEATVLQQLAELYVELEYYKTANICTARLDGERISNNSARQIVSMLYNGKLWYDLTSGRFESKGLSERAVERITKALGRVA